MTMRTTMSVGALVAMIWLPAAASAQVAREGEVTLIGCVELERDYRARKESGRGGVLGTGVGVGNEFVLTSAKPVAAGRRGQPAPAGGEGTDYNVSGKLEKDFLRYVGRMVEVVGVLEKGDGALQSVNVTLWHPVGDYCPAK